MTTDDTPSIELRDLHKSYGHTPVLHGIDLSVDEGEFLTLLGPSGSGKTTTLNLIAGFEAASAGSIHVRGADVTNIPSNKRDLGVVFQHYALFPHLTVFKNIAFPLQQRGIGRAGIRERVTRVLDVVGLASQAHKKPQQLSGGQQQRVALARALVFDPKAMLLDEPLSALDKRLRDTLQLELRRLHQEIGRTFVFVTHDQEEALALSDRIAVFNEGRIEQLGTGSELYHRPETLFVATFIGDSVQVVDPVSGDIVVVRPESVELRRPDGPTSSGPSIAATMRQSTFLGSSWRHELQLREGATVFARTPQAVAFQPGDPVSFSWADRASHRFPSPASASASVSASAA